MIFTNYSQFYLDQKERGIEYAAAHTRALGFDGVEYLSKACSESWQEAKRERQVLDSEGLTVSCYSLSAQLFTDDQKTVEDQIARHIEAAAILGSPYVHHTIFPLYSTPESWNNGYREVFEGIVDLAERIAKRCNEYGLTCLYEPQGMYFNGIEGLAKIHHELKERGCCVGICGDFGNSLFLEVDPVRVFEHFARDIRHVHVKDHVITDQIYPDKRSYKSVSGKRIYDVALGEGVVDFAQGFRALRAVGYDGAVSFELDGSDEMLRHSLMLIKKVIESVLFVPQR